MIKQIIKLSLVLAVTVMVMAFTTQDDSPYVHYNEDIDICSIENRAFQGGEKIVYKIYYNWNFVWIAAGEAVLNVKDIGDKYHIVVTGKTYRSYSWMFNVDDRYESYVDKETLLPVKAIRSVKEGGYSLYSQLDFDQKRNTVKNTRGKEQAVAKPKSYNLDGCMHDMISMMYFFRNMEVDNLKVGQKLPARIFMDKKVWNLGATYKGKESRKKIKGRGRFKALKFSPQLITGEVFEDADGMNLWVTDDKNKIPLLIESPLKVGSVKVVLKSYKNLKHNLDSKVK